MLIFSDGAGVAFRFAVHKCLDVYTFKTSETDFPNVISPPFSIPLHMFFYIINFYFLPYISFYVACAFVICLIKYLLTYLLTY